MKTERKNLKVNIKFHTLTLIKNPDNFFLIITIIIIDFFKRCRALKCYSPKKILY